MLRYWEEELGLPIMRNDQGYRCYTNAQLLMFQRIKILRDAGYQLKAISWWFQDWLFWMMMNFIIW